MLGDSLTYEGNWNQLLQRDDIINEGINGDTTYGILYRLDPMNLLHVKTVCLMIGINDIASGEVADDIFDRYEMIIRHFMNLNIHVIIESTLYVSQDMYEYEFFNSEVTKLNTHLQNFATEHSLQFLDINRHLSDNGTLNSRYSRDGVHLNSNAYVIWGRTLAQAL